MINYLNWAKRSDISMFAVAMTAGVVVAEKVGLLAGESSSRVTAVAAKTTVRATSAVDRMTPAAPATGFAAGFLPGD